MYSNNFSYPFLKTKISLILLLSLSVYFPLLCMEKLPENSPLVRNEWDAVAYSQCNTLQINSFLNSLQTNNIKIYNRTIVDIGCGTGEIALGLALFATRVHGIDASSNMVEFAQKKIPNGYTNVSFEQCFAENFSTKQLYQLAIMSSSFHWLQDKKRALQSAYNSLEPDGEFFANIITSNNPIPLKLRVLNEMKETNTLLKKLLESHPQNPIARSYPTLDQLTKMFNEVGFKIIKAQEQSYSHNMTKEEFIKLQLPIIQSRLLAKTLSSEEFNSLFNAFINNCLTKLERTTDGKYTYPMVQTIVHAIKNKNS